MNVYSFKCLDNECIYGVERNHFQGKPGVSRPIDEENPNEDTLFHNELGVPSPDKTDGRPGRWMEKVRLYHLIKLWQQEDWI